MRDYQINHFISNKVHIRLYSCKIKIMDYAIRFTKNIQKIHNTI